MALFDPRKDDSFPDIFPLVKLIGNLHRIFLCFASCYLCDTQNLK